MKFDKNSNRFVGKHRTTPFPAHQKLRFGHNEWLQWFLVSFWLYFYLVFTYSASHTLYLSLLLPPPLSHSLYLYSVYWMSLLAWTIKILQTLSIHKPFSYIWIYWSIRFLRIGIHYIYSASVSVSVSLSISLSLSLSLRVWVCLCQQFVKIVLRQEDDVEYLKWLNFREIEGKPELIRMETLAFYGA